MVIEGNELVDKVVYNDAEFVTETVTDEEAETDDVAVTVDSVVKV